MSGIDLIAYTTRAMELEFAIYTQKELMHKHQKLMLDQKPVCPKKPKLKPPKEPPQPAPVEVESSRKFYIFMACVSIVVLFVCIKLIVGLPLLGIFMFVACAYGIFYMISSRNKQKKDAENACEKYKNDMVEYEKKMEEYSKKSRRINAEYSKLLRNWTSQSNEYDQKSGEILQKHNDILSDLELALKKHYEQSVIFPKYRNMVAITMINEYLMSGRCFELEGPNGAYNLYESELRQNIIIGQLSTIISSLEQIQSNQFSLYQELVKANSTVNEILYEVHGINESTKLIAYFTGVTALIEASPETYIGFTF